jgi:hypothetical protein
MKRNIKQSGFLHRNVFKLAMVVVATSITLNSCKKDDDEEGDPPSIAIAAETASNVAGNEVSTTLTLNAPEGLQSLVILKNGITHSTETYNGEESATYEFKYQIEELSIGSTVNFTFQALDKLSRTSPSKTFSVNVISKEIIEISGSLTGNVNWTKDKIYRLNGYVRVQDGGKLYIEEGTLVIGDRESKGTLIVQMGGQIFAEGTREEPIIMTSERAPGLREPGDWGGLVICGRASNNVTAVTGQPVELEGGYGAFHGGTNDNDNSGIVRFVRIEFAGIPINPNEEVNSLTMGSMGRGTQIDYVMCSFGLDDSFEWFGGTSDHKYLIAYRGLDDDLDVDLGYSGRVQYALSIRGASLADQSGSNGFEVDNNGAGSTAQPYTSGVFANISVIGPKKTRETAISLQFQHAAQLRRNSRISIYNSFMTGYPNGLYVDDDRPGSGQAALDGHLQIRNVILAGVEHWGGNGYGSAGEIFTGAPANGLQHPNNPRGVILKSHANFPGGAEAYENWFHTESFNNQLVNHWGMLGIDGSIFDLGIPKVTPNAGSMLLNAARWDNTPKADSFFDQVSFIGAFGNEDWTEGWAEWNAHSVIYY